MSQGYRTIQYSFSGGLLSPMQEGAVGTNLYQSGLSIAENLFYGPGYGIIKRHGTQYQASALADSALYQFLYNGKVYGIEFGDFTARLITFSTAEDGGTATTGTAATTPYPKAVVKELSVVANQDKLYIVHHSYKPHTMTITSGQLQNAAPVTFVAPLNPTSPEEGDFRTTAFTFSQEGDYPSRQLFYGGRWFLLATDNDPQVIRFSRTYDSETSSYRYNDFTLSQEVYRNDGSGNYEWQALELADLSGVYLNSDMNGSSIRWAYVHQKLMVATGSAIYTDGGNSTVTSTTDSAFNLSPSLSYGSAGREAQALGSYVFFPGSDNRSVRCVAYNQRYNSYAGSDISSAVARYISGGIKRICTTDGSMHILWVLSNDGELLACYFESGQIIAWSRMAFDGTDKPDWICSLQGGDDGWCSLGIIMKRGSQRFIETLDIPSPSTVWTYPSVDCWKKFSAGSHSTFVQARNMVVVRNKMEDGILKLIAVSVPKNTSWTTPAQVTDYAGLPFAMVAGTLRSELPANGTSQGAKRAIASVTLRLFNSVGGAIGMRPELDESKAPQGKAIDMISESKPILFRYYGKSLYGEAYRLFTGDKATQFSTSVLDDDRLVIVVDEPFPFCVCAIIVRHSITEA